MTGFKWFSKTLHPCALDESSLSIGRVNEQIDVHGSYLAFLTVMSITACNLVRAQFPRLLLPSHPSHTHHHS